MADLKIGRYTNKKKPQGSKTRPALQVSLQPGDGFGGEAVEGEDGKLEVVFAGVFDFVVADATEGLHEEHDRGNAGPRDLGGVVERAGGHAMGSAGNFLDGLVTEVEKVGMKGDGFDAPEARPLDGAFFFFGETAAGRLSFAEHLGKNVGIEVALVEGGFAATDDGGDDAGKCFEAAHGADGVRMLAGDVANFEGEFCGGGEGVAAGAHGRGAGVSFLTVERNDVAFDTFGPEDNGERKAEVLEDGTLFDVELR